ncbi:MAG: chemotaxis protein CheB [Pyrinomonadaceae bacterium]
MKSSTYATGFTEKSGSAPAEIVVIGASAGGLAAFEQLLPALPETMCPPVVIVQHRGSETRIGLMHYLQRLSRLPVREPEDKQVIEPGQVYLAPSGYHLLVERGSFALSMSAPVCSARPSIDVLFETAADSYRERVVGMILTGSGRDGAAGLAKIKRCRGFTVVQEPTTAEARFMPEAALALTPNVDRILTLPQICAFLNEVCTPSM